MWVCRFEAAADGDVQTCGCKTWCLSTDKRITGGDADWTDEYELTVRTANVLHFAGISSAEQLRAMSDLDLLRLKNAGRRTLQELRARGLRADSCVLGCTLVAGHAGPHLPYDAPAARARAKSSWSAFRETPKTIASSDVGALLLWSLRYAMGRRSTAPGDVADCIRRYWHLSDEAHRGFLLRDLREEFERAFRTGGHEMLGDNCDVETWASLLFWMQAKTEASCR